MPGTKLLLYQGAQVERKRYNVYISNGENKHPAQQGSVIAVYRNGGGKIDVKRKETESYRK